MHGPSRAYNQVMVRLGGLVLMLFASAAIALGSPLCCLVGTGCCGIATVETAKAERTCCPHCQKEQPEKPEPKPCDQKGCTCKHDVATHGAAGEHVPLVAVFEIPAVAPPAPATRDASTTSHRALPLSSAPASHPLLL
jgi:hypothetical protein